MRGVDEADPATLHRDVAPLDAAERAWLRRFARVMANMPARLLLVECAGGLFVVDRARARVVDLCDGAAQRRRAR